MASRSSLSRTKSFTQNFKRSSPLNSPQLPKRTVKSMTAIKPACTFPPLQGASPKLGQGDASPKLLHASLSLSQADASPKLLHASHSLSQADASPRVPHASLSLSQPDASPRLRALPLPRTSLPVFKPRPLKKRFSHMSETLERIPNEDWLSALLYAKPEFSKELTSNIEKCRNKLRQHQLVREAINEEDSDHSEAVSRAVSRLM